MWHHNLLLLLLLVIQLYFVQQVTTDTFPNPRVNGYIECGLKSKGYVCDPDKQLTIQERYRLNNDLLQLSRRTLGGQGANFCTIKGVDATLLITKQGNEQLARELNTLWAIDRQCKKSVILVLSTNDHRLYYAVDEHSPISVNDFEKAISEQQQLLNEGKFTMALTTIFSKLGKSIEDKKKGRIKINDIPDQRDTSMRIPQVGVLSYLAMISSIGLYLLAA
ncbi:unnamed protein product [Cercopithifilaria johnstoni]|uniref:TPM domain-containing protein n=1 Tax=Cercopithifilaria johnstoni TaxID=2874296 RepID=A0A8J2LUV5_9BILA|nr:unnamed protein product [Cercopithifilaria johnstoni]